MKNSFFIRSAQKIRIVTIMVFITFLCAKVSSQQVSLLERNKFSKSHKPDQVQKSINKAEVTPITIPGTIEAEDFTDMNGIVVEKTYDILNPDQNIGWIENSNWVEYRITVANTGNYVLSIRGASPNQNSYIKVFIDNVEQCEIPVMNTGSWTDYATYSARDFLNLTEGNHTLKLQFFDGDPYVVNVNYLEIKNEDNAFIEAEYYSNMSGIDIENTMDIFNTNKNIGWTEEGDWVEYPLNVVNTGNYALCIRGASPNTDSYIKIFIDNVDQFDLPVINTGSWAYYVTYCSKTILSLTKGNYTLKLQFYKGSPYVANINFLELINVEKPVTNEQGVFEAEDFAGMSGIDIEDTYDIINRNKNIGWMENGDWVEYPVSVTNKGNYTLSIRGASPNPDSYIKVFIDNKEQFDIPVFNTGSWADYVTYCGNNLLALDKGDHTLKLQFHNGSPYVTNINYLEIKNVDKTFFEAEDFTNMSGIKVDPTYDIMNTNENIGWTEEGDWVEYSISVTNEGEYALLLREASPNTNSYIKVFVDDQEQFEVPVLNTGSWAYYATYCDSNLLHLSKGDHTLKLQFYSGSPYVVNINFLEIVYIKEYTVVPQGINVVSNHLSGIRIYPNPADNLVFVDMPAGEPDYTFEIFDITGKKLVNESNTGNQPINMSLLPSGVYYLRIGYDNQFVIREVLKR